MIGDPELCHLPVASQSGMVGGDNAHDPGILTRDDSDDSASLKNPGSTRRNP